MKTFHKLVTLVVQESIYAEWIEPLESSDWNLSLPEDGERLTWLTCLTWMSTLWANIVKKDLMLKHEIKWIFQQNLIWILEFKFVQPPDRRRNPTRCFPLYGQEKLHTEPWNKITKVTKCFQRIWCISFNKIWKFDTDQFLIPSTSACASSLPPKSWNLDAVTGSIKT